MKINPLNLTNKEENSFSYQIMKQHPCLNVTENGTTWMEKRVAEGRVCNFEISVM